MKCFLSAFAAAARALLCAALANRPRLLNTMGQSHTTAAAACSENATNVRVVMSIPIYQCTACAKRQFENVLSLNDNAAIVSHINAHFEGASDTEVNRFMADSLRRHGCAVRFNPKRLVVRWGGASILRAHTVNYWYSESAFKHYTHFSLVAADMLFVRPGYADFIQRFDGPSVHCASKTKAAIALADPYFQSAMGHRQRSAAAPASCPLLSFSIDGLFYKRQIFGHLTQHYPYSNTTEYAVEELFPANLLTPKLCNPVPRSIVHMVSYMGGGGGRASLPPLGSRKHVELDECVRIKNAPTPCFVLKSTGFHMEADPIARIVMRTAKSNGDVKDGKRRRRLRRPAADAQQQQRWPRVCEMKRCTGEAPAGGVPPFAGCSS